VISLRVWIACSLFNDVQGGTVETRNEMDLQALRDAQVIAMHRNTVQKSEAVSLVSGNNNK